MPVFEVEKPMRTGSSACTTPVVAQAASAAKRNLDCRFQKIVMS
jgi:hypothetical protein